MIAHSIIVLIAWISSIFLPFFLVRSSTEEAKSIRNKDSHFMRG